jgi:hypothetical protein
MINARKLVMLGCVAAMLVAVAGCSSAGHARIRRGTPITLVQRDVGVPDVIADESGDQKRYYVPAKRPPEEWPADAPRTFYYLDRNLAVTFVLGKAVKSEPIRPEQRERLAALVRRDAAAED